MTFVLFVASISIALACDAVGGRRNERGKVRRCPPLPRDERTTATSGSIRIGSSEAA